MLEPEPVVPEPVPHPHFPMDDSPPRQRRTPVPAPRSAARVPAAEPRRTDTVVDPNDPVAVAIARLRLASVDRVLREARIADPALTLGAAIERLRALEPRLMWFGRSIVWWEDGS